MIAQISLRSHMRNYCHCLCGTCLCCRRRRRQTPSVVVACLERHNAGISSDRQQSEYFGVWSFVSSVSCTSPRRDMYGNLTCLLESTWHSCAVVWCQMPPHFSQWRSVRACWCTLGVVPPCRNDCTLTPTSSEQMSRRRRRRRRQRQCVGERWRVHSHLTSLRTPISPTRQHVYRRCQQPQQPQRQWQQQQPQALLHGHVSQVGEMELHSSDLLWDGM